jgi:hypothetical protein
MDAVNAKLERLVVGAVTAIVRGEVDHQPAWVVALAGNLDADVQARIRELREERERLAAELDKARVQRGEFVA